MAELTDRDIQNLLARLRYNMLHGETKDVRIAAAKNVNRTTAEGCDILGYAAVFADDLDVKKVAEEGIGECIRNFEKAKKQEKEKKDKR